MSAAWAWLAGSEVIYGVKGRGTWKVFAARLGREGGYGEAQVMGIVAWRESV